MLASGAVEASPPVPVSYMQIPGPYTPAAGSAITSGTTYNLPGYGQVNATWTAPVSSQFPTSGQDLTMAYNQQTSGGPTTYSWLTDTQALNFLDNIRSQSSVGYTLRLTFLNGQPNLSRLLVAVIGLASNTTVTVSQAGTLAGEYQLPLSYPSAPTAIDSSGTILSSNYSSAPSTDPANTGWALFQVTSSSTLLTSGPGPYIELRVNQGMGDGIGFTLGYTRPVKTEQDGLLKICKVAGSGVSVGAPFTFNFTPSASPLTVPAGPTPGGYCEVGPSFPVGTAVTVSEAIPPGGTVTGITVAPNGGTTNLSAGTANVTIGNGVTELTYINERHTGYIEICKAGRVRGDYSFNVNPGNIGPITVPVGACSPAVEVPAGQVTVQETNGTMTGCSAYPATPPCVLGPNGATVNVNAGDVSTQTIVTVQNGGGTDTGSTKNTAAPRKRSR